MINSAELKIGNIVNYNGEPLKLSKDDIGETFFSPIPINPEILEKCGFRKGEKWYIHQCYYIGTFELCYNRNETIYGDKTEHGFDKRSVDIKYLHWLQNLYFFITGKELVYTP